MDSSRIKAVIDLKDYIDSLGHDRPPVGVFFKELGLDPKIVSDFIVQHTQASQVAIPEAANLLINDVFKYGITIGYKYAIKKQMQELTGMEDPNERAN